MVLDGLLEAEAEVKGLNVAGRLAVDADVDDDRDELQTSQRVLPIAFS